MTSVWRASKTSIQCGSLAKARASRRASSIDADDGADLLFTGAIGEQLAVNVAEYYDIPLATLHIFPMRANGQLLPFLPRSSSG